MASNFETFAKRMTLRGEAVARNADKLIRRVALAVDTAIVVSTPVDTGRARANWQVQVGQRPGGTLPAPDSPGRATSQATSAAREAVKTYTYDAGPIYITNNLPYIQKLNEGSSSQAPSGFVERAVQAGVQAVRKIQGLTSLTAGVSDAD